MQDYQTESMKKNLINKLYSFCKDLMGKSQGY